MPLESVDKFGVLLVLIPVMASHPIIEGRMVCLAWAC